MQISNPWLEELFKVGPYSLDDHKKQNLFLPAVQFELTHHWNNNDLIHQYFKKKSFDPSCVIQVEDLLPIPAKAFKSLGESFITGHKDQIVLTLRSSATSGTPSVVNIDKETSRRQVKALSLVLADRLGKHRRPFLIIDVDPRHADPLTVGARGAAVKGFLNLASRAEYFIKEDQGRLKLDLEGFRNHVAHSDTQDVIIFGFTYVIYAELIEKLDAEGIRLPLPPGSMFVHIGGWKKLEDKKVSKEVFNKKVSDLFSIPEDHVIDFYGFTEQMGVTYPDCECGWKHVPAFAEVVIRNEQDHTIQHEGIQGLIELITPIPHSYPGNVVLTDDLGMIAPGTTPPCHMHRNGTRFRVLGRAKASEPRGCGDVMADKLFSQTTVDSNGKNQKISLLFAQNRIHEDIGLNELSGLLKEIKMSQDWLSRQKVDMLIGLIDKVAKKWERSDFSLADLQNHGLSFLIQWCSSENLKKITDQAIIKRNYLDQFLPAGDRYNKYLKANPKGIAVHWLSGNVPVLGMLVLIQCIITKNVNILKASHSYTPVIPRLLQEFEGESYRSAGGEVIRGDDLLKTLAVVYFDRSNYLAAELLSQSADIRIAWGGKDAVEMVSSLSRKYTVSDIIFGPKLSFMVIGKEMLKDGRALKRLLRNTALDASVFNQTACASPHTIFVEEGGEIQPVDFASRLALEMGKVAKRIPNQDMDVDLANAIETVRIIFDFKGEVWKSDDASWTVMYDEECTLATPTYGRAISVKGIDDIFRTLDFVDHDIQTIGLALEGKRKHVFAQRAAEKGADRFPVIGMMTHFEDPWDGIFVIQHCIKWKTLGGPL